MDLLNGWDVDDENIMKKLRTPLNDDYVVELLSEHGDCERIIGWGPDLDAAHQCYDATVSKYPHTTVIQNNKKPVS
jgi:hypothetical protein